MSQTIHPDQPADLVTERRRLWRPWRVLSFWALLAISVMLWWTVTYTGFAERAAEWQFTELGRYYPALTLIAIATLVTVPLALLLLLWRRVRKREAALIVTREERTVVTAKWLVRILFGICIVALTAALITVLLIVTLPGGRGSPAIVTVGTASASTPAEGPARLAGTIDYARVAKLRENVLITERNVYIAPVLPANGAPGELRYFTVVEPINETRTRFAPIASGVLKHNALPPEIAQLYRNLGLSVGTENWLLLRDDGSVSWRYVVFALDMALLAIIAGIFGLFARRSRNKLTEQLDDTPIRP